MEVLACQPASRLNGCQRVGKARREWESCQCGNYLYSIRICERLIDKTSNRMALNLAGQPIAGSPIARAPEMAGRVFEVANYLREEKLSPNIRLELVRLLLLLLLLLPLWAIYIHDERWANLEPESPVDRLGRRFYPPSHKHCSILREVEREIKKVAANARPDQRAYLWGREAESLESKKYKPAIAQSKWTWLNGSTELQVVACLAPTD